MKMLLMNGLRMSDEPVALRDEDAFDVAAVAAWLRESVGDERRRRGRGGA